jgi:Uma2 family endonuclease
MTTVTMQSTVPRTLDEHYAEVYDDDAKRELIDGTLIVSPGPAARHAYACSQLGFVLGAAAPAGVAVLSSPTNVDEEPATNLQPDLSVVRLDDLDVRPTELRPMLVVEVLSPSSRRIDPVLKRAVYERMGIPSYWIVDPTAPTLVALELRDGRYAEVAHGGAGDEVMVEAPFPVAVPVATLSP